MNLFLFIISIKQMKDVVLKLYPVWGNTDTTTMIYDKRS